MKTVAVGALAGTFAGALLAAGFAVVVLRWPQTQRLDWEGVE